MKTGDRITGLILSIIGAVVWIYSNSISTGPLSAIDASFFPKVIGILLIFTGILLFLNSYTKNNKEEKDKKVLFYRKEFILILVYAIYIISLPLLGFLILTPLLLISTSIYLGSKGVFSNIISGVLLTVGIYLSFKYLLNVPLPTGILS